MTAPHGPEDLLLLRLEDRPAGPGEGEFLMVAARGPIALALGLRFGRGPATVSLGLGRFPHDALRSDRDALMDALSWREASRHDAVMLGLAGNNPHRFVLDLLRAALAGYGPGHAEVELPVSAPSRRPAFVLGSHPCNWGAPPMTLAYRHGEVRAAPPPGPVEAPFPARVSIARAVRGGDRGPKLDREDLVSAVSGWHARASALAVPAEAPWLVEDAWSPHAYAWYLAAGTEGERRRQAARVQPAFVTALPLPDIAPLVDAGRPYERALAVLVERTFRDGPVRVGPAAMRSLRLYRGTVYASCLDRAIRSLSGQPAHRHPSSTAAWHRCADHGLPALRDLTERLGLDSATLLRGVDGEWAFRDLFGCPEPDPMPIQFALVQAQGARDMAGRFQDTFLPALGVPDADAGPGYGVASATLLRGLAMRDILAMQRAWHADGLALRAAAPMPPDTTWPALFPPFAGRGGVKIRCLVTPAELAAEGSAGPDADGIDGLDHCVGGYARDCTRGATHIASVRGTDADGRPVRLSTIEIRVVDGTPRVIQHNGIQNLPPPPEAVDAAACLLAGLLDGSVPLDPVAAAPRAPGPGPEPVPFAQDPAVAAQVVRAWLPHLPRRYRRTGGLDLLRAEALAALAAARPAVEDAA